MMMLAWVALAYLIGSIPAAYLAGKWLRGIDLRAFGSGNLGATNVYRVLGIKAALVVFLFDVAKGAVPVLFFPVPASVPFAPMIYGAAAFIGHVRPVYLRGKGGGKGVATATGVFFALVPVPMVLALSVWIAVFTLTRIVSLASIFAAASLPVAITIWYGPQDRRVLIAAVMAIVLIWTHRKNIARLRAGTEPRLRGGMAA
jgi:acyl phosphate:glycerol-3-phosphate acyltransferase